MGQSLAKTVVFIFRKFVLEKSPLLSVSSKTKPFRYYPHDEITKQLKILLLILKLIIEYIEHKCTIKLDSYGETEDFKPVYALVIVLTSQLCGRKHSCRTLSIMGITNYWYRKQNERKKCWLYRHLSEQKLKDAVQDFLLMEWHKTQNTCNSIKSKSQDQIWSRRRLAAL